MKRKISLLIAVIMVLSLLPAMGVSAATKNTMIMGGDTVADDFEWSKALGSMPTLSIREDSDVDTMAGKKFSLVLNNYAEWDKERKYGEIYPENDASFIVDRNNGATMTSGITSEIAYTITFITSDTAEIVVAPLEKQPNYVAPNPNVPGDMGTDGTVKDKTLRVSLPIIMTGQGEAQVTVANTSGSGVSGGTYTLAYGASGTTTTTIRDSSTTFANTLIIDNINVTETVPNTLKVKQSSKKIEFIAPSGFEWSDPQDTATARAYLGWNGTRTKPKSGAFTVSSTDEQLLQFNMMELDVDPTNESVGAIEFSGLSLKRSGSTSETPTGDVRVKVNVPDGTNEYITVGVFSSRAVTLTVEDKALPEIISGVYKTDGLDEQGQVLDFTLQETSISAWNTKVDAILKLPDGVKFRGASIEKATNVRTGLTNSTEVELTYDKASADKQDKSLEISDTQLTIRGDGLDAADDKRMEIKIRAYVTVEPGFVGDITISTDEDNEAFSSSLSGVVAKAIDPFTVSTVSTDVRLGYMDVAVGDIIIKENQAGALRKPEANEKDIYTDARDDSGQEILLWIGTNTTLNGVVFKDKGKYEVTSGDLTIDKYDVAKSGGALIIEPKRSSSVASELKLSGMTIDSNRSVPQGKLDLRIGGSVVSNFYGNLNGKLKDFGGFDIEYFVADPAYINIITAAEDQATKYTTEVSVVVGERTITANGQAIDMDVAAFIQDGYTMVPVRAVAVALGIDNSQIVFDNNTRTVTIQDTNRGRASQFKVGENYINNNGMSIPFDGPSAMIVDGRTFLPFRALGEIVLGCPVYWEDSTRTAYYNRQE